LNENRLCAGIGNASTFPVRAGTWVIGTTSRVPPWGGWGFFAVRNTGDIPSGYGVDFTAANKKQQLFYP
jgi:hypothetical protein